MCFKLFDNGICKFFYPNDYSEDEIRNTTEEDLEPDYRQYYEWDGSTSKLTLIHADYDRWIGILTINGNEATYLYRYENWVHLGNEESELTEKEKNWYKSTFVKIE